MPLPSCNTHAPPHDNSRPPWVQDQLQHRAQQCVRVQGAVDVRGAAGVVGHHAGEAGAAAATAAAAAIAGKCTSLTAKRTSLAVLLLTALIAAVPMDNPTSSPCMPAIWPANATANVLLGCVPRRRRCCCCSWGGRPCRPGSTVRKGWEITMKGKRIHCIQQCKHVWGPLNLCICWLLRTRVRRAGNASHACLPARRPLPTHLRTCHAHG